MAQKTHLSTAGEEGVVAVNVVAQVFAGVAALVFYTCAFMALSGVVLVVST